MENVPLFVSLLFSATALATFVFAFMASRRNLVFAGILLVWVVLQSIVALTGFYTQTQMLPPRFILLVAPTLIGILLLFLLPAGRRWMDGLKLETLAWLHVVRVPVEIVLFLLFVYGVVPQLMTFEGRNLDILSGITAPFIAWFGYRKNKLGKWPLLAWNLICLGLLFNIVAPAILSAPTPFQQYAFDQPNIAVFHFPFHLLPGFIVPIVLFSHLVAIRRILAPAQK